MLAKLGSGLVLVASACQQFEDPPEVFDFVGSVDSVQSEDHAAWVGLVVERNAVVGLVHEDPVGNLGREGTSLVAEDLQKACHSLALRPVLQGIHVDRQEAQSGTAVAEDIRQKESTKGVEGAHETAGLEAVGVDVGVAGSAADSVAVAAVAGAAEVE